MFDRKLYNQNYYQNNKKAILERTGKYQKTNRKQANVWSGEWKKNNRSSENSRSMLYRAKRKASILTLLGGCCNVCGLKDIRLLQVDHINGGGTKERNVLGLHQMHNRIMSNPSEYQLLCVKHNWLKRFDDNPSAYESLRLVKMFLRQQKTA